MTIIIVHFSCRRLPQGTAQARSNIMVPDTCTKSFNSASHVSIPVSGDKGKNV